MNRKNDPDTFTSAHDRRYDALVRSHKGYNKARLRYFKARIRTMLRFASPLALDALSAMNLRTVDVIERFGVPNDWPQQPLRTHDTFRPCGFDFLAARPRNDGGRKQWHRRFALRHQGVAGCVIEKSDDLDGGLAFRLCGDGLEIAALTPTYLLTSAAGKGRLHLAGALPLTVGSTMLGRPIGEFISHPLLDGRSYPVKRVVQPVGGTALIVFETGRMAIADE